MLEFCSLYSGSTGNSLFVKSDNTKILIDVGVSMKKIVNALTSFNVSLEDIDGILITHEHSDHICSLETISKKFNIPVYASKKTCNVLSGSITNKKPFCISDNFEIGDLNINTFSTPHDAIDSCGFTISNNNKKLSIATDLGHITSKIFDNLENSNFIMLEANYDPEVLKCSSYPYHLKQRILGPNGHLENSTAGKTISKLINSGLNGVLLGHLSKENNFPELAKQTVLEELLKSNYTENSISLNIASRSEPSQLFNVS